MSRARQTATGWDEDTSVCNNSIPNGCSCKGVSVTPLRTATLPTDSEARKNIPMARGLLYYFPNALAEVARLSKTSNEKHNPGEELHWSRGKSDDHADTIIRHLAESGEIDTDGFLHDIKVAWRGLALAEAELIKRGAKPGRAARITGVETAQPERDG